MSSYTKLLLLGSFLVVVDQFTKQLIPAGHILTMGGPMRVDTLVNSGASFSVPVSSWLVIGSAMVVLVLFILFSKNFLARSPFWQTAAFIIAGGISNLFDRFRVGGVIDIFEVGTLRFNISDVYIVIGVVLFFWSIFSQSRGHQSSHPPSLSF